MVELSAPAEAGETVVITRDDQPIAELKPSKRRPIGLCEGEFEVPDDFDEPLPNIVSLFEGE